MPQRQSARFNVPRHDLSAFTQGVSQGNALAVSGAQKFSQGLADFGALKGFMKEAEGEKKSTIELAESLEEFLPDSARPQVAKMVEQLAEASPREAVAMSQGIKKSLSTIIDLGFKQAQQQQVANKQKQERLVSQFALNPGSVPAGAPPELVLAARERRAKLDKSLADLSKSNKDLNPGPIVEQFLPSGQRIVTQDGRRVPGTNQNTGQRISFDDQGRPIIESGLPNQALGEPTNKTRSDIQQNIRSKSEMLNIGIDALSKLSRDNVGFVASTKSASKNILGSVVPGVVNDADLEREDVRTQLDLFRNQMIQSLKFDSQLSKDEKKALDRITNDPKGFFSSPEVTKQQIDTLLDLQVKSVERGIIQSVGGKGITNSPVELERAAKDLGWSSEFIRYILEKYYGNTE